MGCFIKTLSPGAFVQDFTTFAVIVVETHKKVNMKRAIKSLTILLSAIFLLAACSSDDETETKGIIIEEIKCGEQVDSFFRSELPNSSVYRYAKSFFCSEDEFDSNVCYVINSQEEFENVYHGNTAETVLPEIDFTKYSLIIGQERPELGYKPKEQIEKKLYETTEGYVLELHYRQLVMKPESVDTFPEYIVYYWGVYPKLTGHHVKIKLIITK